MKRLGIKKRVLLVALVPALATTLLLGFYFVHIRFVDLENSLNERGLAIVRQFAPAAEYGVISGNREVLEKLAASVLREADVKAVVVRDARGSILVRQGAAEIPPVHEMQKAVQMQSEESAGRYLISSAPIIQTHVMLEDFFDTTRHESSLVSEHSRQTVLGRVYVTLSREILFAQRNRLLLDALAITLLVLAGGVFLALRMSQAVTRPVIRLTEAVQKIADGDFSVRVTPDSGGSVQTLEDGINVMAMALKSSHADLERRIVEATAELKAKREEAEGANKAKSRFLAAASHDLRQPMHALGLFVAQLNHRVTDPDTRHLAGRIEASVVALQGLLDALLDVSRLDAGVVKPNFSNFNANAVLERIENGFAEDATRKGLRFRIVRNSLMLYSDPVLLERILINLVANAVRYTETGGILVGCRRRGDQVRVEVWDTGVGIAPEHQQAIFQEFYQVANPERDRGKGLGLGLSIAARLARLLSGRIEMQSVAGKGSLFAVEVPRGKAGAMPGRTPEHQSFGDHLRGKRVLVVDDDALARESIEGLLSQWGCETLSAMNGAEALALLARDQRVPDAIVCDYRLPRDETGIEVIRQCRAQAGVKIPAMLITGDTAPERLREAKNGGFALLHKPVRPARLRTLLEHLIQLSSASTGVDG